MKLKKFARNDQVTFDVNFGANASIASMAFPVADYLEIVEVREAHTAAGTDGGAVTLTIEKLTGTQANAGGQNSFKTSTINLKTAANTVSRLVTSALSGLTAAQRAGQLFSPGDRIGVTFGGNLATLAGVGITIVLRNTRPAAAQVR